MFEVVIDNEGRIIKADKAYKSQYLDATFSEMYHINSRKYSDDIRDGSNFFVGLNLKKGGKRYCAVQCYAKKGKIIAQCLELQLDNASIFQTRERLVVDKTTGLYNQFILEEIAPERIARYNRKLLVFRARICNLEEYRILLGRYFVEDVVKQVAKSMIEVFGEHYLFSISQEEFIALKEGGEFFESEVIKRAENLFKNVLVVDNRNVKIDMRIGSVSFRNKNSMEGVDLDTLLKLSKVALDYASRSNSTNHYALDYHDGRIPTDFTARGVIEKMVANSELAVHYQPQIELKTGKIVCFEALTRIISEEDKYITTQELINVAEQYGGILPLGEYVYKTSMQFARRLCDLGYAIAVSINVSTVQLLEMGFVSSFINYMKSLKLDPSYVHIEVTESAMMYSIDDILPKLELLIKAGIDIHIDDFGTGYSSLSYLKRIPSSAIKIDKSFIDDIGLMGASEIIVDNLILVGKKLKKAVIAEGVETPQQIAILRKHNCDIIQGYVYSKALCEEKALELLEKGVTVHGV